jgi:hypothetical protein
VPFAGGGQWDFEFFGNKILARQVQGVAAGLQIQLVRFAKWPLDCVGFGSSPE